MRATHHVGENVDGLTIVKTLSHWSTNLHRILQKKKKMVISCSLFLSCSSTLFWLFMVRCRNSILNKDRTVKSEEEKSATVTSMSMLMMEHDPLQGITELSAYWHI